MASSVATAHRQAVGNSLAPQLPLIGEARTPAVQSPGCEWLMALVAEAIDRNMSRKEAAIRLGISEPTLSKQIACEDGKCMRFDRFAELGAATALDLADLIRKHFGIDDPGARMEQAMALVTKGMAMLVTEARR